MKPTFQMSKKLDFNLDGTKSRLEKVEEIITVHDEQLVDYFEKYYIANKTSSSFMQDIVSSDLEKMADYLLYEDNKEQRLLERANKAPILSKSQSERNKRKEALSEDLSFYEEHASKEQYSFYKEDQRYKNKCKFEEEKPKKRKAKYPNSSKKRTITKKDLDEFPVLEQSQKLIDHLKQQIKDEVDSKGDKISEEQLRKMRWFAIELKKDQVTYRNSMKKEVNAKSVIKQNLNAEIDINFSDIEVIEFLFHDYSFLKQYSFEDTDSDLKHILMDFEILVDNTDFSDIVKEIFILKIDGYSHEDIISELQAKFNTSFSKQHLSTLIRSTIPKKLIETYKKQIEDWFYLEVAKGKYKTCKQCGEVRLATPTYFRKDKQKKFGVKNVCKICDRTK